MMMTHNDENIQIQLQETVSCGNDEGINHPPEGSTVEQLDELLLSWKKSEEGVINFIVDRVFIFGCYLFHNNTH